MLFNEALIRDIEASRLDFGGCDFWWLGQMGLVVKTARKVLYFDPYLTDATNRLFPSPLRAELIGNADLIFGTHDHIDHIDDPTWQAVARSSPKARFVLPSGLKSTVARRLEIADERLIGLGDGEAAEVDGVAIQAIAAAHECLNDRDENMIFIVRVDGLTLCHMGDTCVYDGLTGRLKAAGEIDLLMLPINGRDAKRLRRNCIGNMTYQEAVDLAGQVRPRLTVPGHYDMFEGNTEDPALFASYMEIKYPERDFWIGQHARRVHYTR